MSQIPNSDVNTKPRDVLAIEGEVKSAATVGAITAAKRCAILATSAFGINAALMSPAGQKVWPKFATINPLNKFYFGAIACLMTIQYSYKTTSTDLLLESNDANFRKEIVDEMEQIENFNKTMSNASVHHKANKGAEKAQSNLADRTSV